MSNQYSILQSISVTYSIIRAAMNDGFFESTLSIMVEACVLIYLIVISSLSVFIYIDIA